MKETQVKKFKLNVINIKNSLFKSNKTLSKIKKEKIKLYQNEQNRQKVSKKEASLESSFKQSLKNVGQQLINRPLNFLDKFKDVLAIILMGILVNNLPKIILTLQNVFNEIKKTLDKNPLIIQGIKLGFKIIGFGIMGLVKLIKDIKPYIGGSFKFALDSIRVVKNQIGTLIKTFDELDVALTSVAKMFGATIQQPKSASNNQKNFAQSGGYGRYPTPQKKPTAPASSVPGIPAPSSTQQAPPPTSTNFPPTPSTASPPDFPKSNLNLKPQQFAVGGTVKPRLGNIPRQEGTGRGGPSDVRLSSTSSIPTPFARPGGTAKGRKAIQSVNSFKLFEMNVKSESRNIENQGKNYELFDGFLSSYKILSNLRKKYGDDSTLPPITGPGGTAPIPDEPISVNAKEVIGRVGSTGMSTGPHIHLESMSKDKTIPLSLRKNIMVGGKSLTSNNFPGMTAVGDRLHPILKVMKYHAGEDWPAPQNSNITLRGGLKFVKYIKEGTDPRYDGYGNISVIQDTDGKQYFMAHLNSGPPNLSALLQRQQQQLSRSVPGGTNAEKVWNFFRSKPGMTDIAVSGIMGNAEEESRFDPLARGRGMGPGGSDALGLFQWGENARWVGLSNWAKKNKLNPNNIDTQLRWSWIELGGNYSGTLESIKNAKTPEEAAEIWRKGYEVASGGVQKRQTNARNWYKKWNGKKPIAPSQVSAPLTPIQKLERSIIETMVEKLGVNKIENINGKTIKIDTDRSGRRTLRVTTTGGLLGIGSQNVPLTESNLNDILEDLNKLPAATSSIQPIKKSAFDGGNGIDNSVGNDLTILKETVIAMVPGPPQILPGQTKIMTVPIATSSSFPDEFYLVS